MCRAKDRHLPSPQQLLSLQRLSGSRPNSDAAARPTETAIVTVTLLAKRMMLQPNAARPCRLPIDIEHIEQPSWNA